VVFNRNEGREMNCKEVRGQLSRWYDGEVGEPRIRAHVAVCPRCAAEIRAWGEIDIGLALAPPIPDLSGPIIDTIARHRRTAWWLKAAAAAVVALGLGAAGGASVRLPYETVEPDATPTLSQIEEHFAPGTQVGIDDLAGDLPVPGPGGRS
jgi:hypothetical protein